MQESSLASLECGRIITCTKVSYVGLYENGEYRLAEHNKKWDGDGEDMEKEKIVEMKS